MTLEDIFNKLKNFFDNKGVKVEVDKFYQEIKDTFDFKNLYKVSDQDINDFLSQQFFKNEEKEEWFRLLTKLKLDTSLDILDNENQESARLDLKNDIRRIISSIAEPEEIIIENNVVKIEFSLKEGSEIQRKIQEYSSWTRDHIVETIAKQYNIDENKIVIIDSVSSYVDFIAGFDDMNYVSRGQKNCRYKLTPSLHRVCIGDYNKNSADFEDTFRQKILFYDNSTEYKTEEELRAYGQHFGLPTNYLDFTEAHLISLLFAVEDYEYIENHSIVYFIDALSYNQETIRNEIKLVDFSNKDLKQTTERNFADKSYFIKVGNSNERIHFQKGCFLKIVPNDNLTSMLQKHTKIAIIDKNFKKKILQELFNLGITFENIYPDKDNLVKTIKFIKTNLES